MVRKDGAEIRKQRMQEVAALVMRQLTVQPRIDLSDIMPELQYQTGLTRERILEYLGVIASTGRFELDVENGKIMKLTAQQATPEQILQAAREPLP